MDNDKLLDILLLDCTTGKNLIWATDNYESLGEGFQNKDFITAEAINGERGCVVKPRNENQKPSRPNVFVRRQRSLHRHGSATLKITLLTTRGLKRTAFLMLKGKTHGWRRVIPS